jgi:hypothetical protein
LCGILSVRGLVLQVEKVHHNENEDCSEENCVGEISPHTALQNPVDKARDQRHRFSVVFSLD